MAESQKEFHMRYQNWCKPYDEATASDRFIMELGNFWDGIKGDHVPGQGAKTVDEAIAAHFEGCKTPEDVDRKKFDFFTHLYNGCVKLYSCKGPSGLERFEKGIEDHCKELLETVYKQRSIALPFASAVKEAKFNENLNLFGDFEYYNIKCPKGHVTVKGYRIYSCDSCHTKDLKGVSQFCVLCNFDFCPSCLKKNAQRVVISDF